MYGNGIKGLVQLCRKFANHPNFIGTIASISLLGRFYNLG